MDIIFTQARLAAIELCEKAKLAPGSIVVVGCSTSEISGNSIGTSSNVNVAAQIFNAINSVFQEKKIFLAAQCCEHLNRTIIIEKDCPHGDDIVNVIPIPKAGGSFAACAYTSFANPIAVESIRADGGIDIGGTLIGMHLKPVAVPLRLSINHIGEAILLAARTRPKFVGGARAVYNEDLI